MTSFVSKTATGARGLEARGLRLLVTGVSGFAGTHLRSHLVLRGHEVVVLESPDLTCEVLGQHVEFEVTFVGRLLGQLGAAVIAGGEVVP